nr:F-box/FBD/LRR-repeat protein At1g13570-like [Tanacetum cinerariifolium]
MEQLHGTLKEPKYVSEDIISSMPDNVMSNILDSLPVQDAVRTSILSKDWSFRGFANLVSLDLDYITFESYQCGELLTQCQSLEYLRLASGITTAKIKEVEIVKLKNLEVLSLELIKLENMEMITRSTIFRLMSFFPKLQKLDLDIVNCKIILEVHCISFGQLRKLRDVALGSCRDLENEVCFIKSILACSPVLKKMSVISSSVYSNQVLGSHDRDREQLSFWRIFPLVVPSGLAGHFGRDKTLVLLHKQFYWPKMERDVNKLLERCRTYHIAKTHSSNAGLYTPLSVLVAL